MEGKWIFPSTGGGEKQGLNNTGIEEFKDDPIKSLAREICQNSLDAAENYPVTVEFNTFDLAKNKFPNSEEFLKILNDCRDFKINNKDAKDFFDKAIKLFNRENISFLRISDFSTTGLCENNWSELVEESGESNKSAGQSGSKGIGKHAPFACSELRTVFYSSFDKYGVKRSKGVSRLTSHVIGKHDDGTDDVSQGTGYFGIRERHQIKCFDDLLNLDPRFERHEHGTDVYVAGFGDGYGTSEILYTIEAAIIDSFLMAIWDKRLCIKINGKIINKDTIFNENFRREISPYLKNSATMLNMEMLIKGIQWSSLDVVIGGESMGQLKVAIDVREDTPKGINKVAMIRSSGMKIFDKTDLCPMCRFSGMCIIEGQELNDFLRKLESAQHNRWSPDRNNRKISEMVLNSMYDMLKQHINKLSAQEDVPETDVLGAGDYLPDIDQIEGSDRKIKSIGYSRITTIKIRQKTKVESNTHMETDESGDDLSGNVKGSGTVDENGEGYEARLKNGKKKGHNGFKKPEQVGRAGDGDTVINQNTTVKSKQIRIFSVDSTNKKYKLIFYPTVDCEQGFIEVNRVAENDDKKPIAILNYKYENDLRIDKNRIGSFKFIKDEKISLILELDVEEYSTMEVKLYAYKG